jgi:formiminotetrahydrofolate cyclodeaminase
MKLRTIPLTTLLEAFRSPAPTPGGGSASALAGALGASLLVMVAELPNPRAATPQELRQLQEARERCRALAQRLEVLIDADSDAYDRVVAAYRLTKATDEDRERRSARIQEALTAATETPLDVMRACASALEAEPTLCALGNANAASDVGVARELLGAGLRGARLNVEINLERLKDSKYVARVREDVARMRA